MDFAAAFLSIIGTFLNAKESIWSFIIWIIVDIYWLIYFYRTNQIPLFITMLAFMASNLYGIIEWKKNGKTF